MLLLPWVAVHTIFQCQNDKNQSYRLSQTLVSAKDVILEVLRIMSVKGGVGKIIEYGGGCKDTFCSGVQPSQIWVQSLAQQLLFSRQMKSLLLSSRHRAENDWVELLPDEDAVYDEVIDIDLAHHTNGCLSSYA